VKRLRTALRGAPGDAGTTLSELIVAIVIFGVLLTVVTGLFTTMSRSLNYSQAVDGNVRNGSNGMNELVRQIRGAYDNPQLNQPDADAFDLATTESMRFTTLVNLSGSTAVPQQVTFSITPDAARNLAETRVQVADPTAGYFSFGGATTRRVLTTGVAATPAGGVPLFVYFDSSGAAMTPDATGALTQIQRSRITSVGITLRVRTTSSSSLSNTVEFKNRVDLANLATTGGAS
jgi:type II secretory pathway pseudopilin PulG